MAYLSDDGTLDTVIVCERCGLENRFNYDPFYLVDDSEQGEAEAEEDYDAFIDECIASVEDDCLHCGDGDRMEQL
jgi:hypothetical protein